MSRAVIIVPLQEGASQRAAELLRNGPPFDPEEVGLERHHVFLTVQEAVFLFEADDSGAAERLVANESFWSAAAAWKDLVAGPPRLADDVYSWLRSHVPDDVSFASTPGQRRQRRRRPLLAPPSRLVAVDALDIATTRRRLEESGGGYEIVHESPGPRDRRLRARRARARPPAAARRRRGVRRARGPRRARRSGTSRSR